MSAEIKLIQPNGTLAEPTNPHIHDPNEGVMMLERPLMSPQKRRTAKIQEAPVGPQEHPDPLELLGKIVVREGQDNITVHLGLGSKIKKSLSLVTPAQYKQIASSAWEVLQDISSISQQEVATATKQKAEALLETSRVLRENWLETKKRFPNSIAPRQARWHESADIPEEDLQVQSQVAVEAIEILAGLSDLQARSPEIQTVIAQACALEFPQIRNIARSSLLISSWIHPETLETLARLPQAADFGALLLSTKPESAFTISFTHIGLSLNSAAIDIIENALSSDQPDVQDLGIACFAPLINYAEEQNRLIIQKAMETPISLPERIERRRRDKENEYAELEEYLTGERSITPLDAHSIEKDTIYLIDEGKAYLTEQLAENKELANKILIARIRPILWRYHPFFSEDRSITISSSSRNISDMDGTVRNGQFLLYPQTQIRLGIEAERTLDESITRFCKDHALSEESKTSWKDDLFSSLYSFDRLEVSSFHDFTRIILRNDENSQTAEHITDIDARNTSQDQAPVLDDAVITGRIKTMKFAIPSTLPGYNSYKQLIELSQTTGLPLPLEVKLYKEMIDLALDEAINQTIASRIETKQSEIARWERERAIKGQANKAASDRAFEAEARRIQEIEETQRINSAAQASAQEIRERYNI